MTMELSVERILVDGSDFGTISRDADYLSDADSWQSLREAEQGQYSSIFVIERDTKSEATEGGRNDLRALRDYPGGVYILISNRLSEQNRRSVFIGMAGFNEKMFGHYERQTGINLQLEGEGRFMTLTQCLEEQNENPPESMKSWYLAIAIPEQEHALHLFAVLYHIFDKAEGFMVRTEVNDEASNKLHYMNLVSQRYVSSYKELLLLSPVIAANYFLDIASVVTGLVIIGLAGGIKKIFEILEPGERIKIIRERYKEKNQKKKT